MFLIRGLLSLWKRSLLLTKVEFLRRERRFGDAVGILKKAEKKASPPDEHFMVVAKRIFIVWEMGQPFDAHLMDADKLAFKCKNLAADSRLCEQIRTPIIRPDCSFFVSSFGFQIL
jgi:hypothetical protein